MSLPTRLGRLRQVDRLGVGGFASVWLYRDDELESDVAVKALADNWAQRLDVRERFLQEARILRRADSDHVVRVYDVGEADGTPYFVMSYADRGTVADLLERLGSLSLDRTVAIVGQAGAGLGVLHSAGVVHRDIKPANLLLRSDGSGQRVMVADLGVAKALLHASGLTHVVGTPAYMAPEQATGGGVDERADVYALGAVAYHLLTGQVAHGGSIADLATAQAPPPPSTHTELPDGVDEAVLRALAHDREERWPTVRAFVEALQHATPDSGHTLYVSPAPYSVSLEQAPPRERDRGSTVLLALVCLLVAVAAFGAAYAVTMQLG